MRQVYSIIIPVFLMYLDQNSFGSIGLNKPGIIVQQPVKSIICSNLYRQKIMTPYIHTQRQGCISDLQRIPHLSISAVMVMEMGPPKKKQTNNIMIAVPPIMQSDSFEVMINPSPSTERSDFIIHTFHFEHLFALRKCIILRSLFSQTIGIVVSILKSLRGDTCPKILILQN